jgi:hypothetical protein
MGIKVNGNISDEDARAEETKTASKIRKK